MEKNRFPVPKMQVTTLHGEPDGRLFPRDHSNGVFTVWDFSEKTYLDLPFNGINQANTKARSEWVVLINEGDETTKPDLIVRVLNGKLPCGSSAELLIPFGAVAIVAKEDNMSEGITARILESGASSPSPEPAPFPVLPLRIPDVSNGFTLLAPGANQITQNPSFSSFTAPKIEKPGSIMMIAHHDIGSKATDEPVRIDFPDPVLLEGNFVSTGYLGPLESAILVAGLDGWMVFGGALRVSPS